jgi:hypothetical protein
MAKVIDFYTARERLRSSNEQAEDAQTRAFVVVEVPLDIAKALETSEHPDWLNILDYLVYEHQGNRP